MRQIRLNSAEQIRKRAREFIGKKINIVLRSRTVLFGELKSVDERELVLLNLRRRNIQLALEEISEVYLDIKD